MGLYVHKKEASAAMSSFSAKPGYADDEALFTTLLQGGSVCALCALQLSVCEKSFTLSCIRATAFQDMDQGCTQSCPAGVSFFSSAT